MSTLDTWTPGLDELYEASHTPVLLHAPKQRFVALDGHGSPDGAEFCAGARLLRTVSGELSRRCRHELGLSLPQAPLEAIWRSPDGDGFAPDDRLLWSWTMLVSLPDSVPDELRCEVMASLEADAGHDAGELRTVSLAEGHVAQRAHVGALWAQSRCVAELHAFIARKGLRCRGRQHEIYLNDPVSTAPDRMITIIRQPVRERPTEPDQGRPHRR